MLTIRLVGGLGNQLFQLAALKSISKKTNRRPYIQSLANPSHHTTVSYFDTIFYSFRQWYSTIKPLTQVADPQKPSAFLQRFFLISPNIELTGYFQDWRYIDHEFISNLAFPREVITRYPGVSEGIFLHIRGGDYVGNVYHDVGLDAYYERAIAMFPNSHFFVVTNHVDYALSKPYLKDLKHTLVTEPELETLYLMSQCAGGICANSSFSWWGAFLNPHRKIVMPDRWYPNPSMSTEGYYFPGVIKCPV